MAEKTCEICGGTPCENPKLCDISRKVQALSRKVYPLTGNCNGCRQGKPKGDKEHVCEDKKPKK